MTDTPPEATPEDATTPAKAARPAKPRRGLVRRIALGVGVVLAGLLVLIAAALVGGRYYIASDGGRDMVLQRLQDLKISRYGRINVYGLKGDLFDDFTLARVTVTDRDGVWLEARNVRVDWSYLQLVFRRFHADEISADQIRLIRRPVPEPPTTPRTSPRSTSRSSPSWMVRSPNRLTSPRTSIRVSGFPASDF